MYVCLCVCVCVFVCLCGLFVCLFVGWFLFIIERRDVSQFPRGKQGGGVLFQKKREKKIEVEKRFDKKKPYSFSFVLSLLCVGVGPWFFSLA